MSTNIFENVIGTCVQLTDEAITKNENITIAKLTKTVQAQFGISAQNARSFVSLWANDPSSGYYVEHGPKGGIRKGNAPERKKVDKHECSLCGTGLREGRAAALEEMLSDPKYHDIAELIASKKDFDKDYGKLVKKYNTALNVAPATTDNANPPSDETSDDELEEDDEEENEESEEN